MIERMVDEIGAMVEKVNSMIRTATSEKVSMSYGEYSYTLGILDTLEAVLSGRAPEVLNYEVHLDLYKAGIHSTMDWLRGISNNLMMYESERGVKI